MFFLTVWIIFKNVCIFGCVWAVFNLCLCTCLGNCVSPEWPSVIWCLFSHLWSWPSASFLFNEISFYFCVPVWAMACHPKLLVFASCLFARAACTCKSIQSVEMFKHVLIYIYIYIYIWKGQLLYSLLE